MMSEKDILNTNEPEVLIEETDKDYENLLEKFENPKQNNQPKKKKNSHIKALIFSLIGAVVLVGVVLLLIFLPKGDDTPSEVTGVAAVENAVGSDKVHEVNLETDNNGKLKENGSGQLLNLVPADISKIKIKNSKGSYTITSYTPTTKTEETDPETGEQVEGTDTTIYTIVGYEDFDLQAGVADEIASACSTLSFNAVSCEDVSGKLADYGFDKPRAVANITYDDKTTAVIKVGSNAPQNLGTYVMFGSGNAVYLCDTETVEKLLYGINDYMSLTINEGASDTASSEFKTLTLSGKHFKNTIAMKPNPDTTHISNAYILTSPVSTYADDSEASIISGAIRGLYADSVAAVNPSASKLSKLGLSPAYAKLTAKYSDTTVDLIASKPDSEGNCYLMKTDSEVVYKIAAASIPWVETSVEKLVSSYVLNPQLSGLSKMSVTCSGKTYNFDIKTTVTKTTDDNGEETSSTNTVTSYKNEELTQGNFEIFFRNSALLTKADKSGKKAGGSPALTIKYTYDKDRAIDTISYYKLSANKYTVTLNSETVGTVYSSYVEKLISQAPQVAKDKEVKTFW
ncbi:MAG: DUF4340 domain-containing protein [Ruminococcus sp.]|nr:DUF4340 domain-containing protein [Ruminococcus sp.]